MLSLFESIVVSVLTYGSETWKETIWGKVWASNGTYVSLRKKWEEGVDREVLYWRLVYEGEDNTDMQCKLKEEREPEQVVEADDVNYTAKRGGDRRGFTAEL